MKQNMLAGALLCALASFSQASVAAPVTLTASIADGTVLSTGNYHGVFDGSALLPSHYQINSASFLFTFADDQDAMTSGPAQTTGSDVTPWVNTGYYYDGSNHQYTMQRNETRYQSVQQSGAQESASVALGGMAAGAGATAMVQSSSTSSVYNGQVYEGRQGYNGYYYTYGCGNHTCGGWSSGSFNNYYADTFTQTTTSTTDWTGSFSVAGNITDQAVLDQLISSNQLQLDLGIGGDLSLMSARLYLDVTPTAGNAVPEPSTLLLTLLGLFGLVGWTRRRSAV